MNREIKFVCNAVKWRDKVNGNTYHSCHITRCSDGSIITVPFTYGYGEHYRQSALTRMSEVGWIPEKEPYCYERDNNYPILWNVSEGLKRDCVANGKLE